jgi:hypothetical protein
VHARGWSPIGNDKKNGKKKEAGGSGGKYPTGKEGEEEENVKKKRGGRGAEKATGLEGKRELKI